MSVPAKIFSIPSCADITVEGPNVKRGAGRRAPEREHLHRVRQVTCCRTISRNCRTQPAGFTVTLGAVELGDYWPEDSPNRITGPVQISGEVTMTDGKADGQISIYARI